MISHLALLTFLALPPPPPFAPNFTVSHNDEGGADYYWLRHVPRPAVQLYGAPANAPPEEPGCASAELSGRIPIPPVGTLFTEDWSTIPTVYIGVHVSGFGRWSWPNSTLSHGVFSSDVCEATNYIKTIMQSVLAAYRPLGIDIRIAHIHYEDDDSDSITPYSRWIVLQSGIGYPLHGILHLPYTSDPTAIGPLSCAGTVVGDNNWFVASLDFTLDPLSNDPARGPRQPFVMQIAHEMGHTMTKMAHSQCYYYDDAHLDPIEKCEQTECYPHPDQCPPFDEISFMGYCMWRCYRPGLPTWTGEYPGTQFGPALGPLERIVRKKINSFASSCSTAPTYTEDLIDARTTHDTDLDGLAAAFDNCPNVSNQEQTDIDLDGKGDACDSCAIVHPVTSSPASVLLVLPLALVLVRGRGRGGTLTERTL